MTDSTARQASALNPPPTCSDRPHRRPSPTEPHGTTRAGLALILCLALAGCPSNSGTPEGFEACPEARPEICTQQYDPVCATHDDGSQSTSSNRCTACSDSTVTGYVPGACEDA